MPQVTVTIDGKQYRMACDEGQEDHLIELAGRFDRVVGQLKESFGAIGEGRLTVMAGITLVDEMGELQKRTTKLEEEIGTLKGERDAARAEARKSESALTEALSGLAARMEGLAEKLSERS